MVGHRHAVEEDREVTVGSLDRLADQPVGHRVARRGEAHRRAAVPIDDPQVRQPDPTRAKQLLGWEPEIDVRELRRTIAHYTSVVLNPLP